MITTGTVSSARSTEDSITISEDDDPPRSTRTDASVRANNSIKNTPILTEDEGDTHPTKLYFYK